MPELHWLGDHDTKRAAPKDGRILVVEYKGAVYMTNDDTREKNDVGRVWQAASKGRCFFAMVTDTEHAGRSVAAQIRAALN